MEKIFIIKYEADSGYEVFKDTALIKAKNEQDSVKKLKEYITNISDFTITVIYSIKEFNGIYTGRFDTGFL